LTFLLGVKHRHICEGHMAKKKEIRTDNDNRTNLQEKIYKSNKTSISGG